MGAILEVPAETAGRVRKFEKLLGFEKLLDWVAPLFALLTVLLICLGQASLKPFWYDELITLRISQMGSGSAIIDFFQSGKDTTSFLPAQLVHATAVLPGRAEVSLRLPFIAAFLLTCVCVYFFIRKRYPDAYALIGTLIFAAGSAQYFATEIRAYVFLLLGIAFSMFCWQEANEEQRFSGVAAVGVFVGLAVAIAFHAFAIFLIIPFAVAQWVEERSTSRRRWGVWAALFLFPIALVAMLPGMIAAKHLYGPSFWAKPTADTLLGTYDGFTGPLSRQLLFLLPLLAVSTWLHITGRGEGRERDIPEDRLSASGWTLNFGLCMLPLIGFGGSLVVGVYRGLYVIPFVIGMSIVATALFADWIRQSKWMGWTVAIVLLALVFVQNRTSFVQGVRVVTARPPTKQWPKQYQQNWFDSVRSIPLPIVAEGPVTLADLDYYGSPELKSRLVYLMSRSRALRWPISMTNELNMEEFGAELHFPVQDYDTFVAAHQRFLLVSAPLQTKSCWLLNTLETEAETGHDVRLTMVWGGNSGTRVQVHLVELGEKGWR